MRRHNSPPAALACGAVLVVLGACSSSQSPDPFPAPIRSSTASDADDLIVLEFGAQDVIMGARASGSLVIVGGRCLGVEGPTSQALALFPSGTAVVQRGDGLSVAFADGRTLALGEEFTFGGGGYAGEQLDLVLPSDVPQECLTERVVQVGSVEYD